MFIFGSKKVNRRREVRAAESAQRPKLIRRNAAKNIEYEVPRASTSSDESMSLHLTRSLDLSSVGFSPGGSFRVEDGNVEHICRVLGLSGPDDFAISADAWEASLKARSSSDILLHSRLLGSDSFPRKRENSNLSSELRAESQASHDLAEFLAEEVVLGEEVCIKSPLAEEQVLLEETRVLDVESMEILQSATCRNEREGAGIGVTGLPIVTASSSTASVLFSPPQMSVLAPSIVRDDEPVDIWLSSPGNSSNCGIGIKGARPLVITPPALVVSSRPMMRVLAPPPSMKLPINDRLASTWDIVRSFAPTDENEQGDLRRALDFEVEEEMEEKEEEMEVKEEEEEDIECVENGPEEVLERVVALVETTDGTSSFSTTNDDDSSSTTTEFVISPIGRFKKQIKSWMRGDLLGSGSFGTVYEGISDDGTFIAIKEVSLLDKGSNAQQCILQLEQEIALLSQFEHENIVQYYGTDKEESKLVIFLELVTQGSLASLYQKYDLRDTQVSAYTRQILNGLNYLHERNVVHRDIKCANILVHANGSVKLADFGLAKEISKFSDLKSCKGSVYWMAPEVVHPRKTYGRAADIWSLGCTVLELLTRQIPFPNIEWQHAFYKIGRGEQPPIPNHLSTEAQDFISKCVQVDPNTRPTAAQLLEHPFVTRSLENISF